MAVKLDNLAQMIDELLFFGSTHQFRDAIRAAKDHFTKSDQEELQLSTDAGFTDWYLHNFVFDNRMLLTDLLRKDRTLSVEEKEVLDAIENSILSVFEFRGDPDNYFLKDIFTQRDFAIANLDDLVLMDKQSLHFSRLYPMGDKYILMPESTNIGMSYKELLVKAFMDQYNQYTRIVGVADVEAFVYEHPLMMHKILHILEDLEADAVYDDGEYRVFQSVYLYQELKAILALLDADERFECTLAEGHDYVYKLYETNAKEVIVSEIVLCENRLESECLNDHDLQESKKVLEALLGDSVVFLQDEVVDFDDLI